VNPIELEVSSFGSKLRVQVNIGCRRAHVDETNIEVQV